MFKKEKPNIPQKKRLPMMMLKKLKFLFEPNVSSTALFVDMKIKMHKTMLAINIRPVGVIAKAKFASNSQHL